MKSLLAIAAALALAGCASDGYYTTGYAGYGSSYGQPYYSPYYGGASTYYYDYGTPYYYGYPSVGASVYEYERVRDYVREDRRHDGRYRDRDRDGRSDWRDRNDGQPNWRGPAPRTRGHVGDADPAEHLPNWQDRDGDGRFDPGEEVHRGPRHPGSEGR